MKTIKQNLKTQALEIRELKRDISTGMRNGNYRGNEQSILTTLKDTYRYEHIAYCMIRGREYKEIENKTRPGNEISMSKLNSLIEIMKEALLERNPEMEAQDA